MQIIIFQLIYFFILTRNIKADHCWALNRRDWHRVTFTHGLVGFWISGPVATLAAVIVDEIRLAVMKVGVPLEALEVGGLISWVLIQPIRTAMAKVCNGISGGGGARCGGGLWSKPYTQEHVQRLKKPYLNLHKQAILESTAENIYPLKSWGGWSMDRLHLSRSTH